MPDGLYWTLLVVCILGLIPIGRALWETRGRRRRP